MHVQGRGLVQCSCSHECCRLPAVPTGVRAPMQCISHSHPVPCIPSGAGAEHGGRGASQPLPQWHHALVAGGLPQARHRGGTGIGPLSLTATQHLACQRSACVMRAQPDGTARSSRACARAVGMAACLSFLHARPWDEACIAGLLRYSCCAPPSRTCSRTGALFRSTSSAQVCAE